jgi:hypothetical protein
MSHYGPSGMFRNTVHPVHCNTPLQSHSLVNGRIDPTYSLLVLYGWMDHCTLHIHIDHLAKTPSAAVVAVADDAASAELVAGYMKVRMIHRVIEGNVEARSWYYRRTEPYLLILLPS